MENNNSQTVTLKLQKSYLAAVAIALIVVSCVVAGYFIVYAAQPSGYHEMYLLDAQNQAANYPQIIDLSQNSTFNQTVYVINHMNTKQSYSLQLDIYEETAYVPGDHSVQLKAFLFDLGPGESWSTQAPIHIYRPGTYSVTFKLVTLDEQKNPTDTNNYCILHIDAVAGSA
ncbi:MAG: DUF1616 domain-containing protein [Candidatus Bathyarchaeia archaeon]|jgi:uncharacterized membrane protein